LDSSSVVSVWSCLPTKKQLFQIEFSKPISEMASIVLADTLTLCCGTHEGSIIKQDFPMSNQTIQIPEMSLKSKTIRYFDGHSSTVTTLSCTKFERTPLLVSGSTDKTLRIWRLSDGLCLRILNCSSAVQFCKFLQADLSHLKNLLNLQLLVITKQIGISIWRFGSEYVPSNAMKAPKFAPAGFSIGNKKSMFSSAGESFISPMFKKSASN
jgi:WD40 repeat protein